MFGFSAKQRAQRAVSRADRARDGGYWRLAARLYRKALDRFPANPPIWVQYGHALKESGRHAEAEAAYRIAIRYDPSSADTHLQLGHVLKLQARKPDAEASYLLAAALDPSSTEPVRELRGLGWREPALCELKPVAGDAAAGNAPGQADLNRSGRSSEGIGRLLDALCDVEERVQGLEAVPARMQSEIVVLREAFSRMLSEPAAVSIDAAASD